MEALAQILLFLALAIATLLFFGPVVVITSLMGKVEINKFRLDVTTLGLVGRTVLAVIGVIIWLSVYIPLIFFVLFRVPAPEPGSLPDRLPPSTAAITPTPTIGRPGVLQGCPSPPDSIPSLHVRQVAKACGCTGSDFDAIKIDGGLFKVTGAWHQRQADTALWAFFVDENGRKMLGKPQKILVSSQPQPNWYTWLRLPDEADKPGRFVHLWLLVLNKEAGHAFENSAVDEAMAALPTLADDQPYQQLLIGRVENSETQTSTCREET